jgi:hypothetical protein
MYGVKLKVLTCRPEFSLRFANIIESILKAMATASHDHVLTVDSMNENMRKCRYEVRGEIYLDAVKRASQGKEVIYLNVGNPQALGQIPLTFNRQVMSLMMAPFLMDSPQVCYLSMCKSTLSLPIARIPDPLNVSSRCHSTC